MECKRFFKSFLRIFGSPKGVKTLKFGEFRAETPNTVFRVSSCTTICGFPGLLYTIYRL